MTSVFFRIVAGVLVGGMISWISVVWGYGDHGHRAFCDAAYQLAQPATQQHIDELVAKHPEYENFGTLCHWADDIKSQPQWDWAKPHHYVNFPRHAAKVSPEDCPLEGGCVLSAIMHHYHVLQHNPDDWAALAFLAHFMGDLHQPMHVSFADDLGGNRAHLMYYDEPTNLHILWDIHMLLRRGYDDVPAKVTELTVTLTPLAPLALSADDVLAWANESAAITRRIYSQFRDGQALGDAYTAQWGPILEQRMQQGAQRLAAVLDQLFAEN